MHQFENYYGTVSCHRYNYFLKTNFIRGNDMLNFLEILHIYLV